MATNYFGTHFTANPIITGRGLLHGFIFSHNQTTSQRFTLYDSTAATGAILLKVYVSPEQSPHCVILPRRLSIPFATGLSSAVDVNHSITIWATDLD